MKIISMSNFEFHECGITVIENSQYRAAWETPKPTPELFLSRREARLSKPNWFRRILRWVR